MVSSLKRVTSDKHIKKHAIRHSFYEQKIILTKFSTAQDQHLLTDPDQQYGLESIETRLKNMDNLNMDPWESCVNKSKCLQASQLSSLSKRTVRIRTKEQHRGSIFKLNNGFAQIPMIHILSYTVQVCFIRQYDLRICEESFYIFNLVILFSMKTCHILS